MEEFFLAGQVLIAIIFGGILGWQRGSYGKWAGPRTYALVTAGATLFTVLSITAFKNTPAIMVAQIITGIGFLGVGTILHTEKKVLGLTTAAGLWMAAAIGVAIGLNYYILAGACTLFAFIIFIVDDRQLRGDAQCEVAKRKK